MTTPIRPLPEDIERWIARARWLRALDAAVAWLAERGHLPPDLSIPLAREYVATHIARVETHLRLLPGFRPTAIRAPIHVWHARDGLAGPDGSTGQWGVYSRAGAVETTIAGTHYAVMAAPHVSELGRQVARRLQAVQPAPAMPPAGA